MQNAHFSSVLQLYNANKCQQPRCSGDGEEGCKGQRGKSRNGPYSPFWSSFIFSNLILSRYCKVQCFMGISYKLCMINCWSEQ